MSDNTSAPSEPSAPSESSGPEVEESSSNNWGGDIIGLLLFFGFIGLIIYFLFFSGDNNDNDTNKDNDTDKNNDKYKKLEDRVTKLDNRVTKLEGDGGDGGDGGHVLIFGKNHECADKLTKFKTLGVNNNTTKGAMVATIIEILVFLAVLFPMRHYFIYELGPDGKINNNTSSEVICKFVFAIMVLITIFYLSRYVTFSEIGTKETDFSFWNPTKAEEDYDKLAEEPIEGKCDTSTKYKFVGLVITVLILFLIVVIVFGKVNPFTAISYLVVYTGLSFGIVFGISHFLFAKEKSSDDEDSIINKPYFILNPKRKDSTGFGSMAVTIGLVIGIFGLMWFVGTSSPLTKNEKFDSISIDPINPQDTSTLTSVDTSVDVTPVDTSAVDVTSVDTSLSDPTIARWGGGKSKRVKRKSTRRKR